MEILQTAPNISLLPLSLVDLTLFPHLCTVPLVEELTSDVALIKLKKRRLNKITKDFWIYWQKDIPDIYRKGTSKIFLSSHSKFFPYV